ncbi:MAG: hypothetical protein SGI77_14295 [Pirellulaceae bacterium]|nr:hypothetical protein [Pirellulaceae bacterium]
MNIFGEVALRSYQGMTEALVNWSGRLIPMLWQHLDSPPERSSVAMALRVIQHAMRSWSSEARTQQELSKKLGHATKDDYYRTSSKEARYKPNFKDKPCRTGPKIKDATVTQRKTYQQLMTAA